MVSPAETCRVSGLNFMPSMLTVKADAKAPELSDTESKTAPKWILSAGGLMKLNMDAYLVALNFF